MRIQPAAPGPLSVRQAGTDIVLSADINPTRTDGTPLPAGSQVQVLRMPASQGLRPGLVSERYLVQQFLRQASAIGVFDPRTPAGGAGGRFTYRDRAVAPETAEDAEGADEQGPQGGANETGADAQDGELLGYVAQVNLDRHHEALEVAGAAAARAPEADRGVKLVRTLTTSPLSGP